MASEVARPFAEKEPTFADAWHEVRCLVRWGVRHWKLAILLSVLAAFAVGFKIYRRAPTYYSTVIIDVKANNVFSDGPPPSSRELTRFIMGVALADTYLIELAEELGYDLGPTQGGKPVDLEMFRDSIGLSVYYDPAPASLYTHTRIGLRFGAGDPEKALIGARTLAEHVVNFQNRNRIKGLEMERELALETELGMAQRLEVREAELARAKLEQSLAFGGNGGPSSKVIALQNEVDKLRELLDASTRRTSQSVLRGDFERDASGLGYEIVDRGHAAPPRRLSQLDTALIVGGLTIFGVFPVFLLGLGGLSFKAYDKDSLRRLGLTCFGEGYVATPGLQSMVERRSGNRRSGRG